jgi:hypothetical protein
MIDRLRRLVAKKAPPAPTPTPAPAPAPAEASVVVRAAGTAGNKQRATGLTMQQAMTIAVEEAHAAGITEDARVKEAIEHVRVLWKQARNSANVTRNPVHLDIRTRRMTVEPG